MTSNNVYTEEWRIVDTLLSVVFLQYSASTAENTCFLKMYLSIFLLRFSKGPVSKLWSHWISSLSAVLLQRQFWSLTGFPLTGPACWSCRWQEEPAVLHFHLEHFEFDNWLIIKFLTSLAGSTFFYASPVHWAEVNLSAASRLTRLSRTWESPWTTTASNESPLSSPRGATGRKVHHNSG